LRFHQASVDGWMYYALLGMPLVNGLATSVALETALLARGPDGLALRQAFKTAVGMSFISMLMMEVRHFALCPAAVLDFFRVASPHSRSFAHTESHTGSRLLCQLMLLFESCFVLNNQTRTELPVLYNQTSTEILLHLVTHAGCDGVCGSLFHRRCVVHQSCGCPADACRWVGNSASLQLLHASKARQELPLNHVNVFVVAGISHPVCTVRQRTTGARYSL